MNLFDAIILGIVEGITEFLPVSSTGHLILTSHLLGLTQTEFLKSFEIAIQLGAVLSVIILYGRTLLIDLEIVKRVLWAFIPTAIVGLLAYKVIKKLLLGNVSVVLGALFLGGALMIVFEILHKEKENSIDRVAQISITQAILIGLFQSLALIPGVSRAAATILGGLILGIKRKTIVEFSFLLAIPTLLAATGLDLIKNRDIFSLDQIGLLGIGFAASFFVAILSIKFLLYYIQRRNFILFGIYRILLALVFLTLNP